MSPAATRAQSNVFAPYMATIEERATELIRNPQLMRDGSINRALSAVQTSKERALMYAALSSLPPSARANVVYFGRDGRIYTNRPVLKTFASYSATPRVSTGELSTNAAGQYYNGYYHRRDSDLGADFGYITYLTNVPCASTYIAKPKLVDAYAQTGGEVVRKQDGAQLGAADIGLQFDAKSPPVGQKFSVQNYLAAVPGGTAAGSFHWVCDQQNLSVTFYADQSASTLVLTTLGTSVEQGAGTSETDMLPVSTSIGWSGDCRNTAVNCSVKRDTALAKVPSALFPDGSYFAVNSPGTPSATPTLHWSNIRRGYREANGTLSQVQNWSETQWLDCPQGLPNVLFSSMNAYTESVGIDVSASGSPYCVPVSGSGAGDL